MSPDKSAAPRDGGNGRGKLGSRGRGRQSRPRGADPARLLAFDALRAVHAEDAYANLILAELLRQRQMPARDAAFATELFSGTCRMQGSYDAIIERAGGRKLNSLQPAVLDLLRLGTHQLLAMRVADHAAVSATVELAAATVGRRVTGLINAILRKISADDYGGWVTKISNGWPAPDALALRTAHPRWIVDAYADLLPQTELEPALRANNVQPVSSLVIRPGLATVQELLDAGARPGRHSPYAAQWTGDPALLPAVAEGRAGVQDEGSQLVALALARAEAADGPWLDLCAGPGGKSALLAGLAREHGAAFLAGEIAAHRARLVAAALRAYPQSDERLVITADGTRPAWRPGSFARVIADVPCSGLGALRRRPESRWRRDADAVDQLHPLQKSLLHNAIAALRPGGVVAYVTCSPHRLETEAVVTEVLSEHDDLDLLDAPALLPEVEDAAVGRFIQLWPHRHGTDAMFAALLRVSG
ncbi:RsmB/NOP family class I SAM-dependent RNA methyltransferase [Microlunatus elymi]|uniref:RsmB/NOP family class I SAM-dependent RNA methyltransferase n=1 Tax=Microlunatus elymi TaxID=2596828 RepID=A0A516Q0N2_9ACTN|nr:RsmB/NOP family class I SAM-dependent RNA methyltransferase [Microlunatus elymi]QDP96761.1 RsmB/NOP family class I SAM-dependent RNA methyltransferase [Microlunatus elymi]